MKKIFGHNNGTKRPEKVILSKYPQQVMSKFWSTKMVQIIFKNNYCVPAKLYVSESKEVDKAEKTPPTTMTVSVLFSTDSP